MEVGQRPSRRIRAANTWPAWKLRVGLPELGCIMLPLTSATIAVNWVKV
ncbi:MAG: hypothetical protein CM15mP77_0380 [Synechococcus sp.]|nr:MAG: hypothetical protein CM15mP77_0380 [Synechococcus sp.]